jgi:hypothetical protein
MDGTAITSTSREPGKQAQGELAVRRCRDQGPGRPACRLCTLSVHARRDTCGSRLVRVPLSQGARKRIARGGGHGGGVTARGAAAPRSAPGDAWLLCPSGDALVTRSGRPEGVEIRHRRARRCRSLRLAPASTLGNCPGRGQPPAQAWREAQPSMLRGNLGRVTLKRAPDDPRSGRLPSYHWAVFVPSTNRP